MSFFTKPDKQLEADQLANSYREMTRHQAYKDLRETLTKIKNDPLKILDEKSLDNVTANEGAWIKGRRESVDLIERHIDNILGSES